MDDLRATVRRDGGRELRAREKQAFAMRSIERSRDGNGASAGDVAQPTPGMNRLGTGGGELRDPTRTLMLAKAS